VDRPGEIFGVRVFVLVAVDDLFSALSRLPLLETLDPSTHPGADRDRDPSLCTPVGGRNVACDCRLVLETSVQPEDCGESGIIVFATAAAKLSHLSPSDFRFLI